MNVMAKPGVDKVDFELWSLAVSAINGCGMCMESHEKAVRQGGLGQKGHAGESEGKGGRAGHWSLQWGLLCPQGSPAKARILVTFS